MKAGPHLVGTSPWVTQGHEYTAIRVLADDQIPLEADAILFHAPGAILLVADGGSVWESKLLGADFTSTSEEGLGRKRNDLALVGTVIAALLPPRFLSHLSLRKDHFNDLAVRFSHCIGHCLSVNVHGSAYVRMTQKLLLNLQVHLQRTQQRRIRVPEAVPADSPEAGTYPGR